MDLQEHPIIGPGTQPIETRCVRADGRRSAASERLRSAMRSPGWQGRSAPGRLAVAEALFEQATAGVERCHRRGYPVIAIELCRCKIRRCPEGDQPQGAGFTGGCPAILRPLDPALARLLGSAIPDPKDRLNWRRTKIDRDTAAFAAAGVSGWWRDMGKKRFGKRKHLLVVADFCDRDHQSMQAWRIALQGLADELRLVLEGPRTAGRF